MLPRSHGKSLSTTSIHRSAAPARLVHWPLAVLAALATLVLLLAPAPVGAQGAQESVTPTPPPASAAEQDSSRGGAGEVTGTSKPALEPGREPQHEPEPAGGWTGFRLSLLSELSGAAGELFTRALVTLLEGVAAAARRVVDGVLASAANFVSQTPAALSYASPTVRTLWGVARGIANAGLALVALWGGFNLVVREQLGAPYDGVAELLPRLAVGALLANTSLWWASLAIDANNALCLAFGRASFPAWEAASAGDQALANVLLTLIYLVASLLLVVQMLGRLALLDVLLVLAPLAALCWVLPQTQGWSGRWSSTFAGATFTQFVQVTALKLGASLMTDLTPLAADAAVLHVFLGIAMLVLTLKIPSLMQGCLGDGMGFARYYVYRRAAAALAVSRGAAGAAAGAGGGGGAATTAGSGTAA